MQDIKEPILKISTKVEILQRLFTHGDVESIIDKLDVHEVVESQRFIWEKTVEFGIKAKGKDFSRTDVTQKMVTSSEYQQLKGCKEPSFVCKGTQCIHSNPVCAIEKIRNHIMVMSEAIREFAGFKVESLKLLLIKML